MDPRRPLTWCVCLSLAGMAVAAYLVVPHAGLLRGELVGGAACGGGGAFNCHAVTGSPWGSVLGIPLAFWGLFGYIVLLGLALLAQASTEPGEVLPLLLATVLGFVAVDLALLGVMAFVIRYFCLLCLATYAINLTLLLLLWRPAGGLGALASLGRGLGALMPSRQHPAAGMFWALVLVGALGVGGAHASMQYLSRGTLGSLQPKIREFLSHATRVSVDTAGDPRLGASNAPLQLVEFSDFLCPVCQRASRLNKIMLAGHRGEASLVFKHFPLDTSCNTAISRMVHPGACEVAAASECAHRQEKFWAFHDRVFAERERYAPARIEADARAIDLDLRRFQACLASGEGMEAVRRDIAAAGALQVTSTPTYVLNGIAMPGVLSPDTFSALADELRRPGRP